MDLRSFPVSARWANALLMPAILMACAPTLQAQSSEDEAYVGESPDLYASIRTLEGEATVRKGDVDEPLSLGVPIAEGDVVESHGRGVMQLADGTRVAFATDTRFQVAALFKESDPSHRILLRLDYGRLRITLGRESDAQVRVDTPSGGAFLADGASAGIEVEPDRTARVQVHSGRMVFRNEQDQADLLAGEQLTVYSDQDRLNRVRDFSTYAEDSFDTWCSRALEVRRGPSWERVPPEIRYYSNDLDEHGEWIYVDEYRSWCWRPMGVPPEWRPYWRGRWGAYPGGMTWVSDEPWGFVTYHYGRWGWGAGVGWYWIPGVRYAPAWVAWQTSDTYFGWAPMGYYDRPVQWGYGPWNGGYCWNIVEINVIHTPHLHTHMHDQPGIIRDFERGPAGDRPLAPAWQQGPLVVSRSEFQHPAQMQQFLRDPHAARERMRAYEQRTGRALYRQSRPAAPPPAATFDASPHRTSPAPAPVFRYEPPPASTVPQRPLSRPQPGARQAPQVFQVQPSVTPKTPVAVPPPPPRPAAPLTHRQAPQDRPHGAQKPAATPPPPETVTHRKAPQEPQPHEKPKKQVVEPPPPPPVVLPTLILKKRPLSNP